ncbi:Photosystem I assembly protein Ycf3 [Fundidesulfovibrio magnetotacticus]|uniref:Photosystem I assembly protein Ycf3 n=1 Tax=Fundidesulfovibrio magnetotacticus TaxID=2730080 RepID=A0A6V8LVH5_9BACT|nr:tetratricopeptide repeat protein [Fundidesulfovibrio magnetotacticus]GFK92245.1 Photosystem I assembly protein Ycf3 [Fundidesulfovibrio magnetotacticus]
MLARIARFLLLSLFVLAGAAIATAAGRPKLLVLPVLPAQGQVDGSLGMGVQNALEMTLFAHDGLEQNALIWHLGKLFASEKDFREYAVGRGPAIDPGEAARKAEVRYVLGGRFTDAKRRTVDAWLFDVQGGNMARAVLPLDPDTGLQGLRAGLLDFLASNGLPLAEGQRSRTLWTEKTSPKALEALGAATMEHYAVHGFRDKDAKPDLAPYKEAARLAPESYLARNWLGWGLWRYGDNAAIAREFEAALKLNPDGVDALDGMVTLAGRSGDHQEEARWAGRKAQARGEDRAEAEARVLNAAASDLNRRVVALYDQGKYAETLPLAREALTLREKVLGPEHLDTATSLNNLAALFKSMGDYAHAKPLYERALAVLEKVQGPEHPDTATSLNNLAVLLESMGDYANAKPLYERVLAIREKVQGPEHPDTATSLNNLAGLFKSMGDYAHAKPLYERALAIREKVQGPEHPSTATSLNDLAGLFKSMGDYAHAKPLYERALAVLEKVLGPEHPSTATSLNDLAALFKSMGDYAHAKPLFERVLAIREKVQGPEHPSTATSLNNLAALLESMGDYAQAKPLHERALAIREKALGPEHPDTATSLNRLAWLEWTTGNREQAMLLQERALAVILPTDAVVAKHTVLSTMSHFQVGQGNLASAILHGKQAVNILQSMRRNISSLDKDLQKSFLTKNEFSYTHLADLLMSQGRIPEAQQVQRMLKEDEYFGFVRRDSTQDVRATTAAYTPAEEQYARRFQEISDQLASLGREHGELRRKLKLGLSPEEQARYDALSKDLEAGRAVFLKTLAGIESGLAQVSTERARELGEMQLKDLKSLQGALRELGQGAVLLHTIAAPDKLWLILTTPDAQIARESPVKAADLNALVGRFRQTLDNPRQDPRPLGRELYGHLIAPLRADLEQAGARTLMVSLDGALRYIPMAALHDGEQWLAQRYATVVYTEVASKNLKDRPSQEWTLSGLGLTRGVEGFSPLPAVRGELEAVSRAISGQVKLDEQFTEAALGQAVVASPVLHIASHFQFRPGTEQDSFLLLGDGNRLTLDRLRLLDFNEVNVLTLSACETAVGGTGKMGDGREVESFGAMAQRQGAKGVLATLWSVADESTGRLMSRFYALKEKQGLDKAQALRRAQLEFIEGAGEGAGARVPAPAGGQAAVHAPVQALEPTAVPTGEQAAAQAPAADREDAGCGQAIQAKGQSPSRAGDAPPAGDFPGYSHPFYWAPFILMGNWR